MTSSTVVIKIFVFWTSATQALSDSNDSAFYTAGVVEFRPNIFNMSSSEMLTDHMAAYEHIIRGDEANSTDIVVFPEGTLNNMFHLTFVPSEKDNIIPCLDHSDFADFLIKLSCAARDVKKYLVINLTEKEKCIEVSRDLRPCAMNGLNIYNTNVVFDREGRVVSRYRKTHVYVEEKNTTFQPEYGIFETDFGVRFGHFICFDILFYTPAQELVERYNIKNFVFTSMFYSELPFLTASQLQQSWAWGNNVNLLSAGASYPQLGMTGTGIYAGDSGHLTATMIGGIGVRKLYVARLLKRNKSFSSIREKPSQTHHISQERQADIELLKDPQITEYNSEILNFNPDSSITRNLCYNDFCCNFTLKTTPISNSESFEYYKFRIGVFDGRRTYEKEEWSDIKVCAMYTCISDDVYSCGELFAQNLNVESNILLESIEISTVLTTYHKVLIMPNTLNDQLWSLNSDSIEWSVTDKKPYYDVNLKLIAPKKNLLTFGIYAQIFEKSSARKKTEFWFSMTIILIAVQLIIH